MHRGYIKLWRKMKDWDWYEDINTFRLFIHLLLSANYKEKSWKGQKVCPGEVITGRITLAEETGLTESQVRTSLDKLKSTSDITIKTTNKYSVISINNWDDYQQNSQQNRQQIANKSPQLKKEKKEKNKDLIEKKRKQLAEKFGIKDYL
jgi:preprotein translocase subunit SecF